MEIISLKAPGNYSHHFRSNIFRFYYWVTATCPWGSGLVTIPGQDLKAQCGNFTTFKQDQKTSLRQDQNPPCWDFIMLGKS